MNAEVIKAINKTKKQESKIRKWWKKNGYKVWRVILFPYTIWYYTNKAINKKLNARNKWNEKRAKKIFDYYIPRRADWDDEDKCFYFFDNGMGWGLSSAKHYLKRKDRRFWKNNISFCGGRLRTYLINTFELEGFTKEVVQCSDGWAEITEIIFKINEKEG